MKTYRQTMTPEAQAQLATLDLNRLIVNKEVYVAFAGPENYLTMLRDAIAEGSRILRLLGEIELIKFGRIEAIAEDLILNHYQGKI